MATVSERALIARLNRTLAKENQALRKIRSDSRGHGELGDFAIVDVAQGYWVATHVDLEQLGRDEGVLDASEKLIEQVSPTLLEQPATA